MGEMYTVIRPIHGPGDKIYKPGEVVDASGWKHTDLLVSQRKMRPVTADPELKSSRKEAANAGHESKSR